MESRVKVAGHPLHQMLIVFPLGLLATAVVFYVIFRVSDSPTPSPPRWPRNPLHSNLWKYGVREAVYQTLAATTVLRK